MVMLTVLALAAAGIAAAALQSARVDARIDTELLAEADELRLLAEVGVDPETGETFESPEDLVRTAMQRIIPARNEGMLGFVGGELTYTTREAPLSLEDDHELILQLVPLVEMDDVTLTSITTSTTTYRLIAVPVSAGKEDRSLTAGTPTEVPDSTTSPSPSLPAEDPTLTPQVTHAGIVLAYDQSAERADFRQIFISYTGVAIAAVGIVALVGWLIAGRLLRPVRVLASSARRIGREDLSERIPVTGNDDLSDMTRAVNEMLTRLDSAFSSQRQLLDDVSHELRTPLTVIRGHLELLDSSDPQDVDNVRSIALHELDRMNRFVEDLMTLATADSPSFVRPATLDIGTLTDDVFDSAIALGERRWSIAERAERRAVVDGQRLTQAWLQLAANAVKFSAPDSDIALGSRVAHSEIRLWVEDHGEGISPADQTQIFERFAQVSPGHKSGAGLGLAIVQAIANAHGGTVECESELGVGSTFSIIIPLGSTARTD